MRTRDTTTRMWPSMVFRTKASTCWATSSRTELIFTLSIKAMALNPEPDTWNFYIKRMRKLLVYIAVFSIAALPLKLRAQQSIVYSQYIFNGLLINPAYAGSHVQLSSTLSYRNQWINFDGAPTTATFGIHSAFRKEKVGVGLLMTSDKIGSYSNTGVYGSYAYIIRAPKGVISLGVQG